MGILFMVNQNSRTRYITLTERLANNLILNRTMDRIDESPDFNQKKNAKPSKYVKKGKYKGMLRTKYEEILSGGKNKNNKNKVLLN